MPRLYVIAGHGAGDPGACANGAQEAERVRALAKRMKELGGEAVTLHPLSDDAYASGAVNRLSLPPGTEVVELHMDSASPSARGGHVIIASGKRPDGYDRALAGVVASFWPGRPSKVVSRSNLANPNRAQRRGLSYRLAECGFISNASDLAVFDARMDDVARAFLAAFGINGKDDDMNKTDTIRRPDGRTGTVEDIMGYSDVRLEDVAAKLNDASDHGAGNGADTGSLPLDRLPWIDAKLNLIMDHLGIGRI